MMRNNAFTVLLILFLFALFGYIIYQFIGMPFGRAIASLVSNTTQIPPSEYSVYANNVYGGKTEIIIMFLGNETNYNCIKSLEINGENVSYTYSYTQGNLVILLDKVVSSGDKLYVEFCNNLYISTDISII